MHTDGVIYPEEDFLQLSGLQHFKFCRRQWALIYIENQWAENFRTTDGAILHENAHNGGFTESRGDLLVTRDMRIFSRTLGVSGACDVLEFRRGKTGTPQGVRGLKCVVVVLAQLRFPSHPARGAWIEIWRTSGCI